jgi:DNA-directed RNA polymerase subunit RPC12/RpoP
MTADDARMVTIHTWPGSRSRGIVCPECGRLFKSKAPRGSSRGTDTTLRAVLVDHFNTNHVEPTP